MMADDFVATRDYYLIRLPLRLPPYDYKNSNGRQDIYFIYNTMMPMTKMRALCFAAMRKKSMYGAD